MDVKNLLGYYLGYIPWYVFISEFPECSQVHTLHISINGHEQSSRVQSWVRS